jgi:hypothetical protein
MTSFDRRNSDREIRQAKESQLSEFFALVGYPTQVRMYGNMTHLQARDGRQSGTPYVATVSEHASMLDVIRLAATEMFHTNSKIIETVTNKLSNPNVGFVAQAIESARVELLGDVWFHTHMADDTKAKIIARDAEAINQGQLPSYDTYLGGAVSQVIYGTPGVVYDNKIRNAMARFGNEIRMATMSMDSTAAINVAVDIAYFLELEDEEPEEEPIGPGGNQGEPTDDGEAGGSNAPNEPREPHDGQRGGTSQVPNTFTEGDTVPTNTLTEAPDVIAPKMSPEELKKKINRNVRAGATRRDNKSKEHKQESHKDPVAKLGSNVSGLFAYDHIAQRIVVESVPTIISEPIRLALQTYASTSNNRDQGLYRRGKPSRHAWKVNNGNLKVFERPPKVQGHVSILIDISSSMGCWCEQCSPVNLVNENSRRRGHGRSFLAWQVSAALGKLHPTAEVFAFTSPTTNIGSGVQTAIYPLPAGHQPAPCGNANSTIACGGTPTCAAMLWFKEHLSQRPSSTTAIIITDGQPNGCGPQDQPHVEVIGAEMMAMGMQFGTVFIGSHQYLNLPTEVSVNISGVSDLRNIQPLLQLLDS